MKSREIYLQDWGTIPYTTAWEKQEQLFSLMTTRKLKNRQENLQEPIPHFLIFCEHPPVFTLGKNGKQQHLLLNQKQLEEKGIAFYPINRGGDITFHGPGQIVGYPLLDLDQFYTDIHRYLRDLEEVIILTLSDYGIKGERYKGYTGVWIDASSPSRARKICAMGIRCSRWITMHGFALNVNTDLRYFNFIVPCGISDKQVTSLEKETGRKIPMEEVKEKIIHYFGEVFQSTIIIATENRILL